MKKYKKIFLEPKTKKSFNLHHLCPVHEVTTGIWSPAVAAVTSGLLGTLRADVNKYRPEVYKTEKSKILKKIHKVALGKLLT